MLRTIIFQLHLVASWTFVQHRSSWTPCIATSPAHYNRDVNIVYSQKDKLFYSLWVDDNDRTINIDAWKVPEKPSKKSLKQKPQILWDGRCKFDEEHHFHKFESQTLERNLRLCGKLFCHLVVDDESSGDIILVNRYETMLSNRYHDNPPFSQTPKFRTEDDVLRFDAYKINMSEGKLEYMKSLGGRSLFLGSNQSFCLSSSQFPGLKPNSIYFTQFLNTGNGIHDSFIYNLEEKCTERCYPISGVLTEPSSDYFTGICGRSLQPLIWVAPNGSC